MKTTSKTPKTRKKKIRSRVAGISQRKREITAEPVVGNTVTQQGWSGPGKTNRQQSRKNKKMQDSLLLLEQSL